MLCCGPDPSCITCCRGPPCTHSYCCVYLCRRVIFVNVADPSCVTCWRCPLCTACSCCCVYLCHCYFCLHYRSKLRHMLQMSNLYRVQLILGKAKETDMHAECAILYGKVRTGLHFDTCSHAHTHCIHTHKHMECAILYGKVRTGSCLHFDTRSHMHTLTVLTHPQAHGVCHPVWQSQGRVMPAYCHTFSQCLYSHPDAQ